VILYFEPSSQSCFSRRQIADVAVAITLTWFRESFFSCMHKELFYESLFSPKRVIFKLFEGYLRKKWGLRTCCWLRGHAYVLVYAVYSRSLVVPHKLTPVEVISKSQRPPHPYKPRIGVRRLIGRSCDGAIAAMVVRWRWWRGLIWRQRGWWRGRWWRRRCTGWAGFMIGVAAAAATARQQIFHPHGGPAHHHGRRNKSGKTTA